MFIKPHVASTPPLGTVSSILRYRILNEVISVSLGQGLRRPQRSRAPSKQLHRQLQLYCSRLKVQVQLLHKKQPRPDRQLRVQTHLKSFQLHQLPFCPARCDYTSLSFWCQLQPSLLQRFQFQLLSKQRKVYYISWRLSPTRRHQACVFRSRFM